MLMIFMTSAHEVLDSTELHLYIGAQQNITVTFPLQSQEAGGQYSIVCGASRLPETH